MKHLCRGNESMAEELTPTLITVEIIEFKKLLTVYAHGAKIIVKHKDIKFTANFCDTSIFEPFGTYEEASKVLYPGRQFLVYIKLMETASGHYAKTIESIPYFKIEEVNELDWRIRGVTLSEESDGYILVDCGIPILAFSSEEVSQNGVYGEWFGELQMWLADEMEKNE